MDVERAGRPEDGASAGTLRSGGQAAGRAAFMERPVRELGTGRALRWGIAVETPVEISLNGAPWVVMLATPAHVEDLAVGLAFTERAVSDVRAIERVTVADYLEGLAADIIVPASAIDEGARRRRALEGRTGCGLCGVESLTGLHRSAGSPAARERVELAAVRRALAALPACQPLNQATRSVHAAAWCSPDGEIEIVREDVGRHNALDKAIGALARSGRLGTSGFVVMTSRCSYELVYKAAAAGAALLATVSAPTSLALECAASLKLPIVCAGPGGALYAFYEDASHAPR